MRKTQGKSVHVVAGTDGWVVKDQGRSRPVSIHSTQRDAIDAARTIARDEKGDVIIHGRDGRIRDRDSFGVDPFPPRSPREVLFPVGPRRTKASVIRKAVKEVIEDKS